MLQPGDHLRTNDGSGPIEWQREQQRLARIHEERERRQKEKDRNDDHMTDAMVTAAATMAQMRAFEEKLDLYDEAIVNALMENEEKLAAAKAKADTLLEQAYAMEDGRRVFRTEDGTEVFDEHGQQVGADELDPDLIWPNSPRWEAYSSSITEQERLNIERQKIIEFQEKVDATRDDIVDGDISEADLDDLDAELKMLTPPPVRNHLPDAEPVPEMAFDFESSAKSSISEQDINHASKFSIDNL